MLTNIRLSDDRNSVVILDQTLLPGETKYIALSSAKELHEAIFSLRVRGAPAIGIFAAFALYVLSKEYASDSFDNFYDKVVKNRDYLNSSRPTAVNLSTQLDRMVSLVKKMQDSKVSDIIDAMHNEAESIYNEDVRMCKAISERGTKILKKYAASAATTAPIGIMTQCNAGPLATSQYGTGLGPILLGHELGMNLCAYVCETRPLLQGARLTAFELINAGIDSTLICDNMAATVLSQGKVQFIFTGCDRVARNGDVANKIGTLSLAILAKHFKIPFYVFGPSTTIDPNCKSGSDIEIELRDPSEISKMFFSKPVAPEGIKCYNPSFDVTPYDLITEIITENGVFTPF